MSNATYNQMVLADAVDHCARLFAHRFGVQFGSDEHREIHDTLARLVSAIEAVAKKG